MRNGNTEAHTNLTILGYFKRYFKEDKSKKIAEVYHVYAFFFILAIHELLEAYCTNYKRFL